jgi:hypothetical protein
MIGYYIHHHGFGHLARATSICAQLRRPVTALSSLEIPVPHPFAAVVKLPRDDQAEQVNQPTAHGALHWAPHHDSGFGARMDAVARWVAEAQPEAFVTDVSVEIAVFVRLLGVPVIVVALPGKRIDAPHLLAHRLADHIVAAWPQELCVPSWLRPHAAKTSYVGGISRFDGRICSPSDSAVSVGRTSVSEQGVRVLVLGGADGAFGAAIGDCEQACPGTTWTALGGSSGCWTDDPWPEICTADVIVTHAGQSCVADIAVAKRRAVVMPRPRPFDEQRATAAVLRRHALATVVRGWPDGRAWPSLLARALASEPHRWGRWQVQGAAARAATAIESTAQRCATVAAV